MKKSNEEWEGMDYGRRRRWLQQLMPYEVQAQAEERARATGRSVSEILSNWVMNGLLTRAKRRRAETGEE